MCVCVKLGKILNINKHRVMHIKANVSNVGLLSWRLKTKAVLTAHNAGNNMWQVIFDDVAPARLTNIKDYMMLFFFYIFTFV